MIKNLETIRKSKNISQVEMAQKLSIPVSTYNVYENGNRKVPEEIARNIAKILNVEVKDIFLPATFTVSKTKNHTA
ncbi:helix-turn-helix transcriptional regulator [Wansuia hejianensis]|uniref:Helix-turn-helix transcriptional regulator n=1 Tax=Wansuia hejianensis TaxID=2763667 RepID=A0A926F2B6_9FIRM|nr:helix-turn-helix transcriptional regulator [Wansuia hejianensis]MBC8590650.1 helix-turn-helix transcriptional regulator [Wansuia hejianensis]